MIKSEIKMDKRKLIQIIEKELEELKLLTEEVSASENENQLMIEVSLNKARLLCKEIELLQALTTTNQSALNQTTETAEEETLTEDTEFSDPELEIANPDEEGESLSFLPDEFDEADALSSEMDDDLVDEEDDTDESEPEPDEDLIEFEHVSDNSDEEEEKQDDNIATGQQEFQLEKQVDFGNINLDENDDEELMLEKKTIPAPETERPVIREIPKPEPVAMENTPNKEPFVKGSSLNDTIGENKTSETTINTGSISSLRAAIGLNDRFLFIREIFGNNTDKYNKVIDHLDKLETIQQAVDYLKSQLTLQKNETSMKFVELLKRRFTK